jgi:hypothetical protein
MEMKYQLFSLKTEDGIQYWDIVRYDVFDYLILKNESIYHENLFNKRKSRNNLIKYLSFLYQLTVFLKKTIFCRPKYICFICSRNINKDRNSIDIISYDIVSRLLPKDRLIIETNINKGRQFDSICNSGLTVAMYWSKFKNMILKKTSKDNYNKVINFISHEFVISEYEKKVIIDIINNRLNDHRIEKEYYRKLFLFLHPRIIFMVQNGMLKGMFVSANSLGIPIVELQHGYIGYRHLAYSYCPSVEKGTIKTLPDYFFAFSAFWMKDINYPVKSVVFTGNSFYSKKYIKCNIEYRITFILGIFDSALFLLAENLLNMGYKDKICIKLHPHQISEYKNIVGKFGQYSNVIVIGDQVLLSDLLARTEVIVTVDSTCVYEALHNNIRVFLLKIPTYQVMEEIYDDPLVTLIDSAEDIIKAKNNTISKQENKVIYFEEFNEALFNKFLSEIAS